MIECTSYAFVPYGYTPLQPGTVALATALSLLLGKMSFNVSGVPVIPSGTDEGFLSGALTSMVSTSDENRTTRMLLGAVYVYAAATFAKRAAKYSADARSPEGRMTAKSVAWQTASLVGTLVLCLIGSVWASTGYHGQ